MNRLELEEVRKLFAGRPAVDGISLSVPPGCVYGFLGPNGAGKTTTLRMIMGILHPDAGRIRLFEGLTPDQARPRMAYLPEEKGLYKRMRAREFLLYLAHLRGLGRREARARADDWLRRFDLADHADKRCDALSKGMGQKLQIAAALIHDPEFVILDEPFSGLDPVNVELVRGLILQLRDAGRTIIFSTHVMEQAEQICDHVLLLHRGHKLIDGAIGSVRAGAGTTLQIDYEGDGSVLQGLPGVARINDAGVHAELTLEEAADPQQILGRLVGRVRIHRFELREPSLHEIFVRTVGGTPDGTPDGSPGNSPGNASGNPPDSGTEGAA